MKKSKEKLAEKKEKGMPMNFAMIEKERIGTVIKKDRRRNDFASSATASEQIAMKA